MGEITVNAYGSGQGGGELTRHNSGRSFETSCVLANIG